MDQLIQKLISQANITEEQAKQVIDVIVGVIDDRLPDAIANPVIAAMKGSEDAASQLAAAAEGALGKLGGMFGRK